MNTTPALSFVMLHVADLDAALAYFTDTLGFVRLAEQSDDHFHMLLTGEGGIPFGIISEPDGPAPGAVELCFFTPHLENVHADLMTKGVAASAIEAHPFGDAFTIPAPSGEPIIVMRPPAR